MEGGLGAWETAKSPLQLDFGSNSESRNSRIRTRISTIHIWLERRFYRASNGTRTRPKFTLSRRESSEEGGVQNLSRCCGVDHDPNLYISVAATLARISLLGKIDLGRVVRKPDRIVSRLRQNLHIKVAMVCAMEWGGALQGMSAGEKVSNALFLAVNSRHTGESTVDLSTLAPAILVLFVLMM
ncbi:hypothetical protein HU200_050819 [Digitaria exilis]|uniref:Uncharacterized protein n=1 Tax=Digitaria exilis TaxID=1010633 RepID=A0A835ARQ1_9POAL|nr:hypothetical protein HU200_050819 [Digitaria exilis]